MSKATENKVLWVSLVIIIVGVIILYKKGIIKDNV